MPGHGRNTTLMTEMVDGVWTAPRYVDFGLEAGATEVAYSPDGGMLYFLSTQLLEGEQPTDGPPERIWFATRHPDGSVGTPQIMPPTITTHFTHWQFSVAANGNLCFSSGSSGNQGPDIFVARYSNGTYTEPQPLGPGVNSAHIEHCPFVAPDERFLFFLSWREGAGRMFWVEADLLRSRSPR